MENKPPAAPPYMTDWIHAATEPDNMKTMQYIASVSDPDHAIASICSPAATPAGVNPTI